MSRPRGELIQPAAPGTVATVAFTLTMGGGAEDTPRELLAVTAACLAFWTGLSLLVATRQWRSVTNATVLMGAWAMLTLVLPALAKW